MPLHSESDEELDAATDARLHADERHLAKELRAACADSIVSGLEKHLGEAACDSTVCYCTNHAEGSWVS